MILSLGFRIPKISEDIQKDYYLNAEDYAHTNVGSYFSNVTRNQQNKPEYKKIQKRQNVGRVMCYHCGPDVPGCYDGKIGPNTVIECPLTSGRGCTKRWLDVSNYIERGCRYGVVDRDYASTASERLLALEKTIDAKIKQGCVASPFASMTKFSESVSLYVRYHACDYFVLIPEAYYEATVLTKLVDKPCEVGDDSLCRHFGYPSLEGRSSADISGLTTGVTNYIDNPQQLNEIQAEANSIPILNVDQSELAYNIKIDPPGDYVLLIEYVTPVSTGVSISYDNSSSDGSDYMSKGVVVIRFQSGDASDESAVVNLNDCPFTTPCRQVVVDELAKVKVFSVQDANNVITFMVRDREQQPPSILDNSTAVIYLTPAADDIVIEGKVPAPGFYYLVLHYYQPELPESSIEAVVAVDENNQKLETLVPIQHCPSNSGCRALLKTTDGNTRFRIDQNFTITFKVLLNTYFSWNL
ncbi:putative laminin A chain [Operophtera brumata]|uniref:Putative laminin A chain n=1 Tax=Operophtera brumata TaxID=104452 RepID=A0A0L7L878_OPEBR|nr:putative laminin A chain [Operophtera brumata]